MHQISIFPSESFAAAISRVPDAVPSATDTTPEAMLMAVSLARVSHDTAVMIDGVSVADPPAATVTGL